MVVQAMKRRVVGRWRDLNASWKAETIENLGKATSLALRRVVSAEAAMESQSIEISLLQSRVGACREYSHALLSVTMPALADRKTNLHRLLPTMHAWRRYVLLRKFHRHGMHALVRNRWRVQVRAIVGRRFLRWKRIVEFSLAASVTQRVQHGRYAASLSSCLALALALLSLCSPLSVSLSLSLFLSLLI